MGISAQVNKNRLSLRNLYLYCFRRLKLIINQTFQIYYENRWIVDRLITFRMCSQQKHYDFVVVGAGVMGVSTALYLVNQYPNVRCALI